MIKLSIIIPNYNNEKYIGLCIKSILNQTFSDYEIIIIDDGSNDKSIEIIESIIKNKNNIKLIKQYNQNASVARNKGIEKAIGEYMLFIDGDDYLNDNDVLNNMVNKINDNDLLICNYKIIDENNEFIDFYHVNNEIIMDGNNIIEKYAFVSAVPTNKLFKTKVIRDNNIYFDNVDIGQDLNFYLKYLAFCRSIVVSEDYSYCYRRNNNGMTRRMSYSFLDIVKSVECIRKFYINNNIENDNVINAIGFINYSVQMSKLEKYNNIEDKKFIYNYFDYFIKKLKIEKKYIKKNKKLNRTIRLYKLKKVMKLLYLSRYYKKITLKFKHIKI